MAHDAFISYSSQDKPTADAICARLEAAGVRCWIAPRDILPGQEWAATLIEAIRDSRAMVLVFSSHANDSPQVRRELDYAVQHEIPVIPFRIEDVSPSQALQYYLGVPHWLDALTPPLEASLDRLAYTVQQLVSTGSAAGRHPAAAPGSAVPRRSRSKIVVPMLLLAATLAAGTWLGHHLAKAPAPVPPLSSGASASGREPGTPPATPDGNVLLPAPKAVGEAEAPVEKTESVTKSQSLAERIENRSSAPAPPTGEVAPPVGDPEGLHTGATASSGHPVPVVAPRPIAQTASELTARPPGPRPAKRTQTRPAEPPAQARPPQPERVPQSDSGKPAPAAPKPDQRRLRSEIVALCNQKKYQQALEQSAVYRSHFGSDEGLTQIESNAQLNLARDSAARECGSLTPWIGRRMPAMYLQMNTGSVRKHSIRRDLEILGGDGRYLYARWRLAKQAQEFGGLILAAGCTLRTPFGPTSHDFQEFQLDPSTPATAEDLTSIVFGSMHPKERVYHARFAGGDIYVLELAPGSTMLSTLLDSWSAADRLLSPIEKGKAAFDPFFSEGRQFFPVEEQCRQAPMLLLGKVALLDAYSNIYSRDPPIGVQILVDLEQVAWKATLDRVTNRSSDLQVVIPKGARQLRFVSKMRSDFVAWAGLRLVPTSTQDDSLPR